MAISGLTYVLKKKKKMKQKWNSWEASQAHKEGPNMKYYN
jgi:hypothetical protein